MCLSGGCSAQLAKLQVGSKAMSVVEAMVCCRVRSRSDKGGVERVGLQVSVHGCAVYFVSISWAYPYCMQYFSTMWRYLN